MLCVTVQAWSRKFNFSDENPADRFDSKRRRQAAGAQVSAEAALRPSFQWRPQDFVV